MCSRILLLFGLADYVSYDHFRGVVALVRLFSGTIKKGDKIRFLQSDRKYEVLEVGIQNPEEVLVDTLKEGQVGYVCFLYARLVPGLTKDRYVVCNMKNSEDGKSPSFSSQVPALMISVHRRHDMLGRSTRRGSSRLPANEGDGA